MLTLESQCISVVLGGVLILRTLPNPQRINMELQSIVVIYMRGPILGLTIECTFGA